MQIMSRNNNIKARKNNFLIIARFWKWNVMTKAMINTYMLNAFDNNIWNILKGYWKINELKNIRIPEQKYRYLHVISDFKGNIAWKNSINGFSDRFSFHASRDAQLREKWIVFQLKFEFDAFWYRIIWLKE